MKRVLFFGFYDPRFTRTRCLMHALRKRGIPFDECRVDPRVSGRRKYRDLWRATKPFRSQAYDAVFVAFPGFNAVWMAKLLFRTPVVFDACYSVYQAEVEDRRTCRRWSLRAALLFATDWSATAFADVVSLDTQAHIAYFTRLLGMPTEKAFVLPVGADDRIFVPAPAPRREGPFTALFHGSFIPLHGIETILDAAALLKDRADIAFRLVGNGQTAPAMRRRAEELGLERVAFTGAMPQTADEGPSVLGEIRRADVVLGVFGAGRKADLSVPTKIYEAMACGMPIVTADTSAVRELLTPGEHLLTVPPADPRALADALVRLKEDPGLRARLAEAGLRKFRASFTPERICDIFLSETARILNRRRPN